MLERYFNLFSGAFCNTDTNKMLAALQHDSPYCEMVDPSLKLSADIATFIFHDLFCRHICNVNVSGRTVIGQNLIHLHVPAVTIL